ncbi:MAG: F0F1 ATP synthase subunit B [Alphaproteobacteria bacterium]|jgi:F-type H+-transporting ATPase subunit b
MAIFESIYFWEYAAFFIFLAVAIKMGWKRVTAGLDARAAAIRDELDQARKLREEAQGILAEYQRKRRDAEKEADEIVEHAKEEAVALRAEAERKLEESLARRTRLAEEKIGRAEAQAIQDVRNTAIDVAVTAAQKLIAENLDDGRAQALIDDAIGEVQKNVH